LRNSWCVSVACTYPLIDLDFLQAYGSKIVPNHERDFPSTLEIPVPDCLLKSVPKGTVSRTGYLIGAFEIPLTPGVIMDVWMAPHLKTQETSKTDIYWVTTPIDSVPFAILQRMYVVSVTNWGVQSVVQVDLFGVHPDGAHLLMESVTATGE
jgi:hypothetical protein